MARIRVQSFPRPKGFAKRNGIVFPGSNGQTYGSHYQCEDYPGSGDCAPLMIHKNTLSGGLINKGPDPGNFGSYFNNYVADNLNGMSSFPDQVIPDEPSTTYAATKAAAMTNPSRPYVDLPVSLFELRELPMLVRDAGRSVLNQLGSGNLKYQFGIRPIAGDLARLWNFENEANRRMVEIDRLADSEKGLRRTVVIGRYSASGNRTTVMQSNGVFIEPTFQWNKTVLVKAHARWIPDVSMQSIHMASHRRALVERAMLGLGFDAGSITSQAWELIPWSWLADWYGGIGDYLMSQRNVIPCSLRTLIVTKHSTITYTCPHFVNGTTSMTGISVKGEGKWRGPGTAAPVAHFPFLSGRQVGILGSLAVLRNRR